MPSTALWLEHRMHLPGRTSPPPIGHDTGLVPAHGLAGGSEPARALLGRRPDVRRAARVEVIWRCALARQGKAGVTFSDALCSVRLWIWTEGVFPRARGGFGLKKLPDPLRNVLEIALAPAE
jgi:hypothetical protein